MNIDVAGMVSAKAKSSDTIRALQISGNNPVRRDDIAERERLRSASRDFEAIFIKQMLNSMRKTVTKSGLLGGGFAETVYEDMLFDEYAKKMAATSKMGIAEMLYKQLSSYV